MCTALQLDTKDGYHLFGRNMDIEYSFNQNVILVPRRFKWTNVVTTEEQQTQYAILGMATVMGNHPLFADGCNEKGLACAGLNFPGYACYEEESDSEKHNLGPHDMMLWILGQFEKVGEVKDAVKRLNLVNKPVAPGVPVVPLHWIVADGTGESIVIEKTREGLKVYDNTVGVLSNSPTFDWHLTNVRQYMGLKSTQPEEATWHQEVLTPLGQGVGLHGLPGDFSPASRFVRVAYLKSHAAFRETLNEGISQFFHILNNVAMVSGVVITPSGKNDLTIYTACMCQEKGIYYYKTYRNPQINAIAMHEENLDAEAIKVFAYQDELSIHQQNTKAQSNE